MWQLLQKLKYTLKLQTLGLCASSCFLSLSANSLPQASPYQVAEAWLNSCKKTDINFRGAAMCHDQEINVNKAVAQMTTRDSDKKDKRSRTKLKNKNSVGEQNWRIKLKNKIREQNWRRTKNSVGERQIGNCDNDCVSNRLPESAGMLVCVTEYYRKRIFCHFYAFSR